MATSGDEEKSLIGKVKNKAQDVGAGVADALSGASGAGMEKLRDLTAQVNDLLPVIRELGYSVDGVTVGLGLVPDIGIQVSGLSETMDEARYGRILEEKKENKVLCAALVALQTASAMHSRIQIMGMSSDTCSITLGVSPKVSLQLRKE